MRDVRGFTLLELLVVIALMGIATDLGLVMFSKMSDVWAGTTSLVELDARADDGKACSSEAVSGSACRGTTVWAEVWRAGAAQAWRRAGIASWTLRSSSATPEARPA